MTRAKLLVASAALVGAFVANDAAAQSRTTAQATANVGVGYGRNPYLLAAPDSGSGSTQVSVQPSISYTNGTTQATITGNYNRQDFFTKFPSADGYGVAGNLSKQPNERTSLYVSASFDSSILGANGGFGLTPVVVAPVVPTTGSTTGDVADPTNGGTTTTGAGTSTGVPVNTTGAPTIAVLDSDIGLIGLRQRRNTIALGGGLSYRSSEVSSWNFGANFVTSSYPGSGAFADSYRSYGATTGYSRSINPTTSLGLQLSASVVDYDRGSVSKTVTPQVTFSKALSSRWSLNGAVGASITTSDFGTGVTPSGYASLCRSYSRGQLCISASQQPGISGFGGVRGQTNVSASYTRQLAERTTLSTSVSYNHTGNGLIAVPGGLSSYTDYLQASGSLQRQLTRRLSVIGSAGYRDVSGLGRDIPSDIFGRIGLSVSVGGGRI